MKLPEPPAPSNLPPSPNSKAVSLEELLSLKKTKAPGDPKDPSKPARAVATELPKTLAKESAQISSKPVLLVVHDGAQGDAMLQTKLQPLEVQIQLQWLSLQEAVVEKILQDRPYAVVVEFAPNVLDLASSIASGLQHHDENLAVFALGNTSDPQSMFAALRAGVQDFLDIDVPEPVLLQSVKEVLQRNDRHKLSEKAVAEQDVSDASVVALMAARSGMGCSLLAAHLAMFLQAQHAPQQAPSNALDPAALQTLLLDLGGPVGDGALYLNLINEFDFYEAVQSLRRFDRKLASAGLPLHDSGLRILSLKRPHEALRGLPAMEIEQLLDRLRKYFEMVIADLGALPEPGLTHSIASRAQKIWLLCDQSLSSVVATTELIQQLVAQKIDRSRIQLIVCRYESQIALEPQEIAEQLGIPLLATIPERRKVLLQAVNKGELLAPNLRSEPYVKAVQQLTRELLRGAATAPVASQSWWGRIFHRSKG